MNILYLSNYMLDDVLAIRKNQNTFAQAANNKIDQVRKSFLENGHQVTLLSTGLVNNRTFKFYKWCKSKLNTDLYYASIFDFPLLNILSSIVSMLLIILKLHKQKKVDFIIFWNYKPEVALVAYICRWVLGIKIIVDYEDGYFSLHGLGRKRHVFNLIEKIVSKRIDGAILISKSLISRINKKPYFLLNGLTNEKVLNHKISLGETDEVTLMYAGGLDYERGIDVLIEALKYTRKQFVLKVSGKGPMSHLLCEETDKRIKYLGFLKYEETIKHMHQSHILINPQRETIAFAQASFPSKIFDYIATNSLIISSNIGDMRNFSNHAFYIYENDDPRELAARIDEAISDSNNNIIFEKRKKIKQIRDEFLPKNVGRRIVKTLMEK